MVNVRKFTPKLSIGLLITIFFGVAAFIRIYFPHHDIFVGDWIKYASNDAYYYMRLVDNLVHNFPHLTQFDPFILYPGGVGVGGIPFIDWLLAVIIWVVGLGSPTQHTVDVVGVYFPAILAALTVIPVYFIGKALFNRWAGVLAAGLMAVLPGEFLGRSILGSGDTPFAETLFTTTALAFLILAIKTAGERQLTFTHLIKHDWKVIVKPLVYSALAGLFLGLYLNIWQGGMLFIFIIALYFIIQFIINHLRRKSSDHLSIVGFISFLVALICFLPFAPTRDLSVGMVVALFIPPVLSGISLLISNRGLKPFYYPLTVIGIGVVFIAIFYAVAPAILNAILDKFRFVFFPAGSTATTTLEMQPFLSPQGRFSTQIAWGNFTTSFFLTKSWPIPGVAFISLLILVWIFSKQSSYEKQQLLLRIITLLTLTTALVVIYFSITWALILFIVFFVILVWLSIKQLSDEKHWLIFIIWTLIILLATLIQRRFAYYFVVNIALLSAYLSWQVIWLAGLRKLAARPEEITKGIGALTTKSEKQKKHVPKRGITIYHINTALAIIVVFFFVFFFNIDKSKEVASQASFAPSDAWQSSLLWMKDNTPEPFGDPDAYYNLYDAPPAGENFTYPRSAYGVTSWWDYGYWITRIAHRLPTANPAQDPARLSKTAKLFLTQKESQTQETMKELKSSYIITDYSTSINKFWAVVNWAGREQSEFIGIYYVPYQGKIVPIQVFYPEYYRTLLARLYIFNGKAVTNESPIVVSYDEKVDSKGNRYRQITNIEKYSSYQEALNYVASQNSTKKLDIIGTNPFISSVPLEELKNYRMIYGSAYSVQTSDNNSTPEVKIFEYFGN